MKKQFFTGRTQTPRMAAGDFTSSALMDVVLKAEEMWSDGAQARVYKSNSETARAVLENQSARFQELDDKEHDRKVRVNWINPCAITDEACDTNCDIVEDELESAVKEYEYDMCRKTGFSIDREKLRTSIYTRDELAAQGTAKAIKTLDEYWSAQLLLKLKAFSGINVAPSPYTWDDAGLTTNIPAGSYNLKMYSQLMKQTLLNQMSSAYFVEKGDLYVPFMDARLEAANAEGKGDANRVSEWDIYFDLFNFIKAGITEDMFAIDRSAIAFKTYNRYPDTPLEIGGKVAQTHYSVASQILPGVRYGVIYEVTCKTTGGKTRIVDSWRFITEGGIWLNPEACPVTIGETTYTPTGVLSFTQTA